MVSITSNELSFKLSKQIKLCSIVFKDPYLQIIIQFCNLKPTNTKESIKKTKVHDIWLDEFGNSICFSKKEKKITLNDLKNNQSRLINTDLYAKLPLQKAAKISNLLFLLIGKEEDFNTNHFVLAFLGIDGILRAFCFIYDEWIPIPPLSIGYISLRLIAKNINCKDIKVFKNKKDAVYPCKKQTSFLSKWPNPEMAEILKNNGILI